MRLPDGMITLKEACEIWGITRTTFYAWKNKGIEMPKPVQPLGERTMMAFNRDEVMAFKNSYWMND